MSVPSIWFSQNSSLLVIAKELKSSGTSISITGYGTAKHISKFVLSIMKIGVAKFWANIPKSTMQLHTCICNKLLLRVLLVHVFSA